MLILDQVRCPNILPNGKECNRRLADVNGQAQIKCPKCGALIGVDTKARKKYVITERQK